MNQGYASVTFILVVCDIIPKTTASQDRTTNAFANSFFYRTHLSWNKLPLNLRQIASPGEFKTELKSHMWDRLHNDLNNSTYNTTSNSDS